MAESQATPRTWKNLSLWGKFVRVFWATFFFIAVLILIGVNAVFANITGEACGFIHPNIFEIQASIIDDNGRLITADFTDIPATQEDIEFFFSLAADFDVDPGVDSSALELDTYLRIYNEDGTRLLASNDDSPNGGLGSLIEAFGVEEDATIIVEVATFDNSEEGLFTLSAEPVEGAINSYSESEANPYENVYSDTEPIASGGETFDDVIFFGERVQYEMDIEGGQAYNFTLTGSTDTGFIDESELDTILRVYDSSGETVLDENDDEIEGELFSSYLPAFGIEDDETVIIEVATFDDSWAGDYILEIYPVDGDYDNDPFEADDISADIIDGDVTIGEDGGVFEGFIDAGERIWYEFTPDEEQAYEIILYGFSAFSDEEVEAAPVPRLPNFADAYSFSGDPNAANEWPSCLQYFGFVGDDGFVINEFGFIWFVAGTEAEDKLFDTCSAGEDSSTREFLEQCVQAKIRLSTPGRLYFFILLAILIVLVPVLIVDSIEGLPEIVWYVFLILVAIQATTTAMLFLHLGEVSGIAALEEFGYGIFGGITTGSALVFIDKIASRTREGTTSILSGDDTDESS